MCKFFDGGVCCHPMNQGEVGESHCSQCDENTDITIIPDLDGDEGLFDDLP